MAGNGKYKDQHYREAITLYCRAIELCPEAVYYNNRAAAYLMIEDFTAALADANTAIAKEPGAAKYHLRAAKCCTATGTLSDAV